MNNIELAEKVKGYLKGSAAKAKKFEDLVAVSVSLLSENNEDIYVAVRDGEILVAPYAYDDNNCAIEATAETIDKLFSGELSFDKAIEDGSVRVSRGDVAKLKALAVLVPAKKTAKAAPKAKTAPANESKTAAKPAEKPAVKPEPAKAAPKPAAKPAPAKKGKKK